MARLALTALAAVAAELAGGVSLPSLASLPSLPALDLTLGGDEVSGFSYDYAYDPIGNRTSATEYDETSGQGIR